MCAGRSRPIRRELRAPRPWSKPGGWGFNVRSSCWSATAPICTRSIEVTARLLLDAGADMAALTKSWNHDIDAVYLAASAHNKPLFDLFLERGADPTAALVPALWNAGLEHAEAALAHGADPDLALSEGRPL